MTPGANRDRVIKLARDRVSIKQIAQRVDMATSSVRRMIQRAEAAGDVPAGTVAACTEKIIGRLPREKNSVRQDINVTAPARSRAVGLSCSVNECKEVVVVVIQTNTSRGDESLRLCRLHSEVLREQFDSATKQAVVYQARFNGRSLA